MAEFGATRATLHELYDRLLVSGAGGWAGGHYVAAIAYPDALRYILSRSGSGREEQSETAYRLLLHFERGAPLQ